MEESTEDDHHGVQQDIQQIHKVLGENEDLEEEEEDSDEEDDHMKGDGAYLAPSTSGSGAVLSRSQGSEPVPDSLSVTRPLEPSAENLLQINLSYQDMVCTLLDNIKEARRKNAAIQKSVASKTTTYVKGARPITHFQKHYFSAHPSAMPPLSDEAKEIKAKNIPSPFVQPSKSWTADEDRALYEGVRNDGLQRHMKPLMARQEILFEKRRSAIDDEKHQLTREINNITTQLEHLKAPEAELLGDRMRDIDWLKISSLHLNGERSPTECQLRWQNILHPSINKKVWSKEEEARLDEILENAQGRDWTDVINELGTKRSPFDCFSNFQHREISSYVMRAFSQEEDELISELAERFRVGNHVQFNKVAYFMDQRLAREISRRWFKKLNPKSKFGFWTKEEDEALMEGIEEHGFKWTKLTQAVKGRSSTQIRDRWMYTLDPTNTKGNYTFKEDIAILECVKEHGVGNWVATTKKLNEVIGITRTPNSVLHRFNSLFNRFFKKAKGISLNEGASMEVLSSMPLNTILDEMIEYRQSLGEKITARGSRSWKELYRCKKRKPRSPPPRLLAKNASFLTRRNVLSELDRQLMDAVKPIGWALPTPGTWRTFYGSKSVRRQRRHYLFTVLLKALDISVVRNEGLLASMITNAEGVQVLKDNKLIPSAAETTAQDGEEVSGKSKAKSSKSKVKSSQSNAASLKKEKNSEESSHSKTKDGSSVGEVQETSAQVGQGESSQHRPILQVQETSAQVGQGEHSQHRRITLSKELPQVNVRTSQCSVTVMRGNAPTSQANVKVLQGNGTTSQRNVTALQRNVQTSQGDAVMSQAKADTSQSQNKTPACKRKRHTVKTELNVKRAQSVFGQGTLKVENGYLVPVQNYISHFGDKVPDQKVVTLMHPRVGGVVQTPPQAGGLPVPIGQPSPIVSPLTIHQPSPIVSPLTIHQPSPFVSPLPICQPSPIVSPLPVQGIVNVPQPTGLPMAVAPVPIQPAANQLFRLPVPMAQGLTHPATNILQPVGLPMARAPQPLQPQQPGIIHVPGKGYLVPVNCIKQEPGVPSTLPPILPRPSVITTPSMPSSAISGQGDASTGMRMPIQGKQSTVPSNQIGQSSFSETTAGTVPQASTSGQSVSSSCPGVPCEELESGSIQENSQSSVEADPGAKGGKEAEHHQGDKISDPSSTTDKSKSVKFDPVLPVLPPNESTIAGLMSLLLQRKRLEINAGKRASIKTFKRYNVGSSDRGILRGSEGLLQELSSSESVQRIPQAAESRSGTAMGTHSKSVKSDSAERIEFSAKAAADNSNSGEGKWEVRVPVPVGATKRRSKKKEGYWVTVRNTEEHAKALDSIRKSEWYKTLQPRFLSMFLWPALLSIVGPHKKRVLGPKKKKVNPANQMDNQPSGSKAGDPANGDEARNKPHVKPKVRRWKSRVGQKRKKMLIKLPLKRPEGSVTKRRPPCQKWKEAVKNVDVVARRTRSASQKENGQEQKSYKANYVDIPSDVDDSEEEDDAIQEPIPDDKEVHPQAFMAFGYPAQRKGSKSPSERTQTSNETPLLGQSHEELGPGPSEIEVGSSSQKASGERVSEFPRSPESTQGSPTVSLRQRSPIRKKRHLQEAESTEVSCKQTKQV